MFSKKCGVKRLNNFALYVFGTVTQMLTWKHGVVCAGKKRRWCIKCYEQEGSHESGREGNLLPTPVEKKKLIFGGLGALTASSMDAAQYSHPRGLILPN